MHNSYFANPFLRRLILLTFVAATILFAIELALFKFGIIETPSAVSPISTTLLLIPPSLMAVTLCSYTIYLHVRSKKRSLVWRIATIAAMVISAALVAILLVTYAIFTIPR